MAPRPDNTGRVPSEEELVAKGQRVRPIMNEILESKGLVNIAEDTVHVTAMRGPLEEGWQRKLQAFAARIAPGQDSAVEPDIDSSPTA
jgi:hypothetical protein